VRSAWAAFSQASQALGAIVSRPLDLRCLAQPARLCFYTIVRGCGRS